MISWLVKKLHIIAYDMQCSILSCIDGHVNYTKHVSTIDSLYEVFTVAKCTRDFTTHRPIDPKII